MRIGEQGRDIATCELCGNITQFIGTRRCNDCWELEKRIEQNPELALKILCGMKYLPTTNQLYYNGFEEAVEEFYWASTPRREQILENKRKELKLEE